MNDPGCAANRERVSAFVDDQLAGAELPALERHLEACEACRRLEASLRRFKELLRAAEAFRPLRQPPPGFAAAVAARAAGAAAVVPFPARRGRGRVAAWAGFAAAAAAAALLFAWSGQRMLTVGGQERTLAVREQPRGVQVATMDDWLQEHAALARDATLLGTAEEVEFASFGSAGAGGRREAP